MPEGHRTSRVAERLRAELARLLQTEIRDPRVQGVLLGRIEVTGDLQLATVGVRLLPPAGVIEVDPHSRKQLLAGLKAASGRLRTLLARPLGLRRALELRFEYDEGIEAQDRVEELLHEIARDAKG